MPGSFEPLTFLPSLPVFAGWADAEPLRSALKDLGARSEVWTFAEGDVVRFPDEAPAGPVWVAEGCLAVLWDHVAPEYLGPRERADPPAGPWIRGKTAGRYLSVPEASWQDWLRLHPEAALRLTLEPPPALPRALHRSPLLLEPGEVPVHLFRKSRLFLALRAAVPGLFFLFFLVFGVLLQMGLGDRQPAPLLWLLPGLGLVVTLALAALVAWEWSASVLVVTDRSVIVRQTDLWAHRSDFEKLALDRIREAVYSKAGLADSLLRLVNLELEGDSPQGRLVFRGLSRTSRFLTAMEDLRVKRQNRAPGRRVIRQALAGRAGGARAPKLERPARTAPAAAPSRRKLAWRVEKNGAVWFRRHPWLLAQRVLPWIGGIGLVAFLIGFAGGYWPQGVGPLSAAGLVLTMLPAGRLVWEVWDWANDRLSVQGGKVVLVRRRPLWLGEVRQEAPLDQMEQVGIRKETLAALLFDYGTVTVGVGGGEPLVFEHASHPEWIQAELFHRRTLVAQDRERQAVEARLGEVAEILDTWDEARKAGYFSDAKD